VAARRRPWAWVPIVGATAAVAAAPWLVGLPGMLGLDLGNYAARVALFAEGWGEGDPLRALTRWTGCGEPFVLYNGSLASAAAGAVAWLLGVLGAGAERAAALALRSAYVVCDGLAAAGAYWALRTAGRGRVGAAAGAAAWTLGWLRRGESVHAANLEHAAFLALLPWVLGLAAGLVRRPPAGARPGLPRVAALGLLLALVVPIHPGWAVIFGLQGGLLLAAWLALDRRVRPGAGRAAAALAAAAAVGALAAAWFWVPLLAERGEFARGAGALVRAGSEASLLDYLDRSLLFGAGERWALSPDFYLGSAYAGWTVLALGLAGVALPGRRGWAGLGLLAGALSAWVSLRPDWTEAAFGPVYGLASIRFAAPAFAWWVVAAAAGADAVAARVRSRAGGRIAPGRLRPLTGGVLVALVAVDLGSLSRAEYHAGERQAAHPLCTGVAAALAPVWEALAAAPRAPGAAERVLGVPNYELHQGLVVHGRPLADGLERHAWRPGTRDAVNRLRAGLTASLAEPAASRPRLPRLLDALGVRWVTVLDVEGRLPERLPGLVRRARPHEVAALYERAGPPPPLASYPAGEVRSVDEANARVRLEVAGPGGELLVRRQWRPRWTARLEPAGGEPLPLRETERGFVAVELPPGAAAVALVHEEPLAYALADALAALAWLAALGALAWRGRRESR